MNPGVVFRRLAMDTKSIILTSGTLSPMTSFQSELQAPFQTAFEASHVISPDQVWVKCILQDSQGNSIIGNFQNSESFTYQDGIGGIILDILKSIPFGVLCFVPSYSFLSKMMERWKSTGLYDDMVKEKHIFAEPKSSSAAEFEEILKSYRNCISRAVVDQEKGLSGKGGLFFAVYRGKASEGIDFKDDFCRAVIAIGIPYPLFKDSQVIFKKEYNDKHAVGRQLLTGKEWYEIQAFRALNQALGRCIRHKEDWGAVILLDSRFANAKNQSYLSKWIRANLGIEMSWKDAVPSLQHFAESNFNRIAQLQELQSQTSFPMSLSSEIELKQIQVEEVQSSSAEESDFIDLDFYNECISQLSFKIKKSYKPNKNIICVSCGKVLRSTKTELEFKRKTTSLLDDGELHPASIKYLAPSLSNVALSMKRRKMDKLVSTLPPVKGKSPVLCSCSAIIGAGSKKHLYYNIAMVGIQNA